MSPTLPHRLPGSAFRTFARQGQGLCLLPEVPNQLSVKSMLRLLTHNTAYDQQSEGSRDWYVFQLLLRHPERDRVVKRFVRYLTSCPTDLHWGDASHLFHVAYRCYRNGWLRKTTWLARWQDFANSEEGATALDLLLKMGGRGLRLYAELRGADARAGEQPLRFLRKKDRKRLRKLVRKHRLSRRANDPNVAAFLAALDAPPDVPGRIFNRPTTYAEYLTLLNHPPLRGRHERLLRSFTEEQLAELAARVTVDTPAGELAGLLAPFEFHPFPGDLAIILQLNEREYSFRRVPSLLGDIFGHSLDTRARELAFTPRPTLQDGVYYPLHALKSILTAADGHRIAELIRFTLNPDDLHELGYRLQDLCAAGHTVLLTEAIRLFVYTSTCGVCRGSLVEYLDEAGVLTDFERRCLALDTYASTRKRFRKWGDPAA